MDWILFTPKFRAKLRHLARCNKGHQARSLATKVSVLPSAFVLLAVMQFAPGYGYLHLALVSLGVVAVGMLVAYTFPSPFLKLLSFIATDFNQVEIRGRNSERARDKG